MAPERFDQAVNEGKHSVVFRGYDGKQEVKFFREEKLVFVRHDKGY